MHDVERSVIFGQGGIAGIAEDTFEKIQIADQTARNEAARLHGLLRIRSGGRAHDGPQQQRREQVHGAFMIAGLIAGEGDGEDVLRRAQRLGQ